MAKPDARFTTGRSVCPKTPSVPPEEEKVRMVNVLVIKPGTMDSSCTGRLVRKPASEDKK